MANCIQMIPLDLIDPPPIELRTVDPENPEYLELVRSMQQRGLDNSILVRPWEGRFQRADGGHRVSAARELNWTEIAAIVRPMSNLEMLSVQFTNDIRVKPTRTQNAKHLLRLRREKPDITLPELSVMAGKSLSWIKQQLEMIEKLCPSIHPLVDAGKLKISNVYMLAKLPQHMQRRYLSQCGLMDHKQFCSLIAEVITQLRVSAKDRISEARLAETEFKGILYPRNSKEASKELSNKQAGANLVAHVCPDNLLAAFHLGVQWAYHVDPITLSLRQKDFAENRMNIE